MKRWMGLLLMLALLLTACAPDSDSIPTELPTVETVPPEPVTVSGKARLVITGMEWGPVVSKVILELDQAMTAESVENAIHIEIPGENYHGITAVAAEKTAEVFTKTLVPKAVYTCDQWGNATGDSRYIALDLPFDPSTPAPTLAVPGTRETRFCDYYDLSVQLSENAALTTTEGRLVAALQIPSRLNMEEAYFPQLEGVDLDGVFTGSDGNTLTYGTFTPDGAGEHPLVIWLHGGGEGGTDVRTVIYGNEVTALFSEEFQSTMGGAYVLMPQCQTMWMQREENGNGSVYRETLMELIKDYVNRTAGIDPNRIYVGGCSNGGFMTVDLLLHYPDYFTAAYPICGAYDSASITDDQIKSISHVPMWFVQAENDPVVNADRSLDLAFRLRDADAEVHISLFADVHDTTGLYSGADGAPYQYIGHWSWIWFFNNACDDGGLNMWQWLAQQSK